MAVISPFRPFRYTDQAGPLDNVVTQPYDKITPAMRTRYLSLSPYNIVRIILGERKPSDSETDSVYTCAARHLEDWIERGILRQETQPCLFVYTHEFRDPDTGENLTRRGLIGLAPVADYSEGVVFGHERTLSGPKQDRLDLLRHTRAHFGQIFLLYADPKREIEGLLNDIPLAGAVTDEYGVRHTLGTIADETRVARITGLMADRKLLIADGHHRYETALAFRKENPELPGADRVMATFVNMHSPGLRILATHRVLSGLPAFAAADFIRRAAISFQVEQVDRIERLAEGTAGVISKEGQWLLHPIDVTILHQKLLGEILGINQEAVSREQYVRYVRGLDVAVDEVRNGAAQVAFLLPPAKIEDVARISFAGGFMPQKSTDFYPKLLSGLTIYRLG